MSAAISTLRPQVDAFASAVLVANGAIASDTRA